MDEATSPSDFWYERTRDLVHYLNFNVDAALGYSDSFLPVDSDKPSTCEQPRDILQTIEVESSELV